mmetsp:Transcript_60742/g.108383  ORF Transcript_60742/g.108383 Transcript_60742/m.108383 type:complete len:267 (+) Transcript_60742:201-1001(+)
MEDGRVAGLDGGNGGRRSEDVGPAGGVDGQATELGHTFGVHPPGPIGPVQYSRGAAGPQAEGHFWGGHRHYLAAQGIADLHRRPEGAVAAGRRRGGTEVQPGNDVDGRGEARGDGLLAAVCTDDVVGVRGVDVGAVDEGPPLLQLVPRVGDVEGPKQVVRRVDGHGDVALGLRHDQPVEANDLDHHVQGVADVHPVGAGHESQGGGDPKRCGAAGSDGGDVHRRGLQLEPHARCVHSEATEKGLAHEPTALGAPQARQARQRPRGP